MEDKINACDLAYELIQILQNIDDEEFVDSVCDAIRYADEYTLVELKENMSKSKNGGIVRQILFRGKVIDEINKWVYGFLISDDVIRQTKETIQNKHSVCGIGSFCIDKKTLGQYTGLTDKNGKKIFEGDIVHLYGDEHSLSRYKGIDYNALVIFKDGGFCAIDGTEDDYALRRYNFVSRNLYCEVIGNIYDNPELLKEADEI